MPPPPISFGRLDPAASAYLTALRERVVVFDGATGTNLQLQELTADDFGGPELEGCNEILVVLEPGRGRAAPPLVPRRRRRRRRDRHLRGVLRRPRRVRARRPGPGAEPRRRRSWPARSGRRVLDARPAPVGGRQHRPGDEVPDARPDPLRRPPRRLPGAGASGCSTAASTCCSSRPSSTCCRPRPAINACQAGDGRDRAPACRCRCR